MDLNGHMGISMRWLRCVRALRILRLTTVSPSLVKMMRTLVFAAPSIANITTAIFIFASVYAQFGMAFLGTLLYDPDGAGFSRHANFETAFRAMSTLVRMSTADSWSALLADAIHNPHAPGVAPPMVGTVYFFFIFYMTFMGWVLVSIFVAIIIEYFNDSNAEEGVSIKFDDLESFQQKWLEFDVSNSSYIRTVDLGLLLFACKPPLVGVWLFDDGFFKDARKMVRPNLKQLEQILVELDVPDHDGSIHFLELLLALLQRVTGVINEEKIMARLLQLHPTFVASIKRMPAITGSTADAYIKDEVMTHLQRGLKATGLLDAMGETDERTTSKAPSAAMSFTRRSFTRRRHSLADRQAELDAKEQNDRRNSLSRVAESNKQERAVLEQMNKEYEEEYEGRRGSLMSSFMDSFNARRCSTGSNGDSFTRGSSGDSFNNRRSRSSGDGDLSA